MLENRLTISHPTALMLRIFKLRLQKIRRRTSIGEAHTSSVHTGELFDNGGGGNVAAGGGGPSTLMAFDPFPGSPPSFPTYDAVVIGSREDGDALVAQPRGTTSVVLGPAAVAETAIVPITPRSHRVFATRFMHERILPEE